MSVRIRATRGDPPGATGFLSTAGSLKLPIGSLLERGASELAGYYIDFRSKAVDSATPPGWLPSLEEQMHVELAQWALGCLERHALGEGREWLEAAVWAGRHLAGIQNEKGELPHLTAFPHTFRLDPPWLSALAQGEVASLLARLHAATDEEGFADAALGALEPMRVRTADGGAMELLDGRPFPEEYPTTPPSFVLNGAIFALWGFRDVGLGLADKQAQADFDAGVETLAANIHRWDSGWWSLYDLRRRPVRNFASPAYHALHITQLDAMQLVAPQPQLQIVRDRFASYLEGRSNRLRAYAVKALFRVLAPRNSYLARKLPTSPAKR